jgi:hypothetical protein
MLDLGREGEMEKLRGCQHQGEVERKAGWEVQCWVASGEGESGKQARPPPLSNPSGRSHLVTLFQPSRHLGAGPGMKLNEEQFDVVNLAFPHIHDGVTPL